MHCAYRVSVIHPDIEPDGLVLAAGAELAFITGAERKARTGGGIDTGTDKRSVAVGGGAFRDEAVGRAARG
jgi:hypothetical protein